MVDSIHLLDMSAKELNPESSKACSHMDSCEMYKLFKLSGVLETWKIQYCQGDFESCARYRRASCGMRLPQNLMPNGALLKKKSRH